MSTRQRFPSHGTLAINYGRHLQLYARRQSRISPTASPTESRCGGQLDTATVNITISPLNDNDPVVSDNSFTVDEGATATEADLDSGVNLLSGLTDSDLPFDSHTANVAVVAAPGRGSLTINSDGTFSYTHDGSENFTDSFVYRVEDAAGNFTTATVNITINPVNDNDPVVSDNSFTVDEGATATEADLDSGVNLLSGLTDSDLPFDSHTANVAVVAAPGRGSLTLNSDGTFSYTHDGSENFTDSFVYRVEDAAGNFTTATVNITINPVNDNEPVVSDNSFTVDEGATATETDLDSGANLLSGLTDSDLPFDSHTANVAVVAAPGRGSWPLTPMVRSATRTTAVRTSPTVLSTESKMQRATSQPPP